MDSSFYNFPLYDIIENDVSSAKIHWNESGKLLVIVSEEYEQAELKSFLEKILESVHATEANTSIIQISQHSKIKLIDLPSYENCDSIICIGIHPLDIGLNIENRYFEVTSLNEKRILFSPQLTDLQSNLEYKKLLWSALKEHYNMAAH